jgi:hypothetical protein
VAVAEMVLTGTTLTRPVAFAEMVLTGTTLTRPVAVAEVCGLVVVLADVNTMTSMPMENCTLHLVVAEEVLIRVFLLKTRTRGWLLLSYLLRKTVNFYFRKDEQKLQRSRCLKMTSRRASKWVIISIKVFYYISLFIITTNTLIHTTTYIHTYIIIFIISE